ncbi:alpha/beta hydrolase [Streptomyces sp. H10-C2]|uniref:alpha/beta fold hydrolase n=1 Tax=unclassified Streptomyces TaxID=2593676 RepID=UPI0024BBBF21|nr:MULTISPECIES: alpha/beta hydrolase [unclassified Streptomyces]MDJ0342385.1 alpha/beta hydrolase [Streptomyces sp. PH10-H1]MDJ0372240.1 alpha/beta hydrolase [Streptomyces sp. H10-C2]
MSRITARDRTAAASGTAAGSDGSPYTLPAPRRELAVNSADGTRIHVEEHGRADGPTVVLIHGWTCSTIFWAPLIRELPADFRVVAYDQRGHGRSATPDRAGYSTEALADDLAAVLEAVVEEGERAVLVGHSMGGMTLMAASQRPGVRSRTAAAVLASTGSGRLLAETQVLPPRIRSKKVRDGFHRLLLGSRAPLGPVTPVTRAALKYGVMASGSTPEQVAATARIVHACGTRQRSAWGRVLAGLDLDAGLAALTAPTFVLVGTADKLTPPVHARGMAAALPDCVGLTELEGLGHMTPIEGTGAVADVVRGLVRDHLPAKDLPVKDHPPVEEHLPVKEETV